jgi:hypothetical protein
MMTPTERIWRLSALYGAISAADAALNFGHVKESLRRLPPADYSVLCTGVSVDPHALCKAVSRLASNADSLLGELMDADRVSELAMEVLDPAELRALADTLEEQDVTGGAR